MKAAIDRIKSEIGPMREELLNHPIYNNIRDLSGLQKFSKYHVFAVWDFMSLLKSLQRNLTCITNPWLPVGSANTRFLINEIVTGEESDVDQEGNRISHFELYLQAMQQMGSSTKEINELLGKIEKEITVEKALIETELPLAVKSFLSHTFHAIEFSPIHVQAAIFTFGREDLIPDMFMRILDRIYKDHPEKVSIFKYYIERHIEVDGGHHSQLALEMVAELCGNDEEKWNEATKAAIKSLEKRYELWSGILES